MTDNLFRALLMSRNGDVFLKNFSKNKSDRKRHLLIDKSLKTAFPKILLFA